MNNSKLRCNYEFFSIIQHLQNPRGPSATLISFQASPLKNSSGNNTRDCSEQSIDISSSVEVYEKNPFGLEKTLRKIVLL